MRLTKDSGNQWIGEIPQNWDAYRVRYVCEFRTGYTPSKQNPEFWTNGTIPWYRMDDIREYGRKLKESHQYITEEAIKGGGLFEAGSFILATTATIGEHAQLTVDSLANQRFTNLNIRKLLNNNKLTSDYFFYYLYVIDEYCKTSTRMSTFPAVNINDLRDFLVLLPPIEEQKIIADYLDSRCTEIDELISVEERMVGELQDYKLSIITEKVTKGLNPNSPQKESGIPWLGTIPQHWDVVLIGHSFIEVNHPNTNQIEENALQFKMGEIVSKKLGNSKYNPESLAGYNIVEPGTIMINGLNLSYDFVSQRVAQVKEKGVITSTYLAIYPYNNVNSDYATYLLKSYDGHKALHSMGRGIRAILSYNSLKTERIIIPPISEQIAIAEYLDQKCGQIDTLVTLKKKKISELRELKKSLIYEYVTGKKSVTEQ